MQLAATLLLVCLAAAYVGRSAWRTWAGRKAGCGSGCGGCAAKPPHPDPPGRIGLPMGG
ncbi:MAG: FeoB-associated Cys-rich membrane protein [Gemmataceae bacterium]|nr:FeoB-associated Cys-rich membrane protein [Gemmataceae bacterium]